MPELNIVHTEHVDKIMPGIQQVFFEQNKYISKQRHGYKLFYPDGLSVVEETPRDET